NAASTLVGQNLGAKMPDRAERSVWITGYLNMAFMGIISIFLLLFPEFWISIFMADTTVVAEGVTSLRILSYGFILYGLGMVVIQGFNGSGDTFTPTWVNGICFWFMEIPLAYILAITFDFGLEGACYAIIISESMLTLISLFLFRRGKWKLREV
ncbi:MAG: MATE family efflux transporter, partial [bacterium]